MSIGKNRIIKLYRKRIEIYKYRTVFYKVRNKHTKAQNIHLHIKYNWFVNQMSGKMLRINQSLFTFLGEFIDFSVTSFVYGVFHGLVHVLCRILSPRNVSFSNKKCLV